MPLDTYIFPCEMALRTEKGNVTAETRRDKAVLPDGRFPIFDRKSCEAAEGLRGNNTTLEERKKILAALRKECPDIGNRATEKDRKAGLDI